jgi:hypothetical protein
VTVLFLEIFMRFWLLAVTQLVLQRLLHPALLWLLLRVSGRTGSDSAVGRTGSDSAVGMTRSDSAVGRTGSDSAVGRTGSDSAVGRTGSDRAACGGAAGAGAAQGPDLGGISSSR